MKRNKLDILGVCETHLTDSDKTLLGTGEIMLTSGRKDNVHAEGEVLLQAKRVQKSLIGWDPISPWILRASFSTNNKRVKMNILYGDSWHIE